MGGWKDKDVGSRYREDPVRFNLIFFRSDLNVPIVDTDQKEDRKKVLVDYFIEDRHGHDFYAFRFFFCEFLNLFNVVGQLFFMNYFLGGEFTTYGSDVIAMTEVQQELRTDPMSKVFPKVGKLNSTQLN